MLFSKLLKMIHLQLYFFLFLSFLFSFLFPTSHKTCSCFFSFFFFFFFLLSSWWWGDLPVATNQTSKEVPGRLKKTLKFLHTSPVMELVTGLWFPKKQVRRRFWTDSISILLVTNSSWCQLFVWVYLFFFSFLQGLNRCGKSCRLRWTNYLRPDLNHDNFTPEEEESILELHKTIGSR